MKTAKKDACSTEEKILNEILKEQIKIEQRIQELIDLKKSSLFSLIKEAFPENLRNNKSTYDPSNLSKDGLLEMIKKATPNFTILPKKGKRVGG